MLTFVAVVYNNYPDTVDFIDSLKSQIRPGKNVRCVIVDNSDSSEVRDSLDRMATSHSVVSILRPPSNVGYFGAFNYYFDNNPTEPSETVVLCNNDLIFSADFVETIRSKQYADDVFVVCPDVVTLDGVHQNPHVIKPRTGLQRLKLDLYFSNYYIACGLLIIQRLIQPFLKSKKRDKPSQPGYLHMGIGACYVLLPSFLSKFRHLDFPHFLYGEEAYLSKQVHTAGGRLYYDPALKVQHKESATLSKLPKRTTYEFGRDGYRSYRTFY